MAMADAVAAAEPLADERRTSPVELLWDLVFVFAVTQVAAVVGVRVARHAQATGSATLRAALLVSLIVIFVAGRPRRLRPADGRPPNATAAARSASAAAPPRSARPASGASCRRRSAARGRRARGA